MSRTGHWAAAWTIGLLLISGCAHVRPRVPSKEATFRAYADALREGRLADAWALTRPEFRAAVPERTFEKRWATPRVRLQEAEAVDSALDALASVAPGLVSERATPAKIASAREALLAFTKAASARRFSAVYPLLAGPLRARYTPARLARDFQRAPQAAERVRRAELAASGPAIASGKQVRFPLGGGEAVVLVEEADGFKVASLD